MRETTLGFTVPSGEALSLDPSRDGLDLPGECPDKVTLAALHALERRVARDHGYEIAGRELAVAI
jgi:hypothetical protein